MAESETKQELTARLHGQLEQSRQQEERIKVALIRVLKLIDDGEPPR